MQIVRKIYNFLVDSVQSLLLVFAIFLVIYISLVRPFQVSGSSMYPNYLDKEYILTNLIGFENFGFYKVRSGKLQLGDVVVFVAPNDQERDYIKRVIGVPRDQIMIKDGNVYLNGNVLDESTYLKSNVKTYGGQFLRENMPVTVPDNSFFVMGDNRAGSSDSREWGFVPFDSIVGKSWFIYWPFDKMGLVKNPYGN